MRNISTHFSFISSDWNMIRPLDSSKCVFYICFPAIKIKLIFRLKCLDSLWSLYDDDHIPMHEKSILTSFSLFVIRLLLFRFKCLLIGDLHEILFSWNNRAQRSSRSRWTYEKERKKVIVFSAKRLLWFHLSITIYTFTPRKLEFHW